MNRAAINVAAITATVTEVRTACPPNAWKPVSLSIQTTSSISIREATADAEITLVLSNQAPLHEGKERVELFWVAAMSLRCFL